MRRLAREDKLRRVTKGLSQRLHSLGNKRYPRNYGNRAGHRGKPSARNWGECFRAPEFARSERLSRLLRFLVERHLEGRERELKESTIAVEVFGRRPDYDPKQDSTVRTEASRLRARLSKYYAGEGSRDPLVIELPKGGYIPVFRHA